MRTAMFCACVLISFAGVALAIAGAARTVTPKSPAINLNIADLAGRRLPQIAIARAEAIEPLRQIVVLGDSTIISYRPGRQLPDRLEENLADRSDSGPKIRLVNLAISGVAAFDYYFLADEIVRARPDGVLFAFNLDTLSENWRGAYSRPELAGLIAPRRIAATISLPLHWVGLTLDRLLFYVSIVQSGSFEHWYALSIDQAKIGRMRIRVRDNLEALVGSRASQDADRVIRDLVRSSVFVPDENNPIGRFTRFGIREHYGDAMSGLDSSHPVLRALGAMLEHFEHAGIPVFVFVTPVNIEYMESLDMLDRPGLAETIEQIEGVVRGAGADFIDLHALLPDGAFRDGTGHFRIGETHDGPATLAEALAPAVMEHAKQRY